jgi:hypothetical protein
MARRGRTAALALAAGLGAAALIAPTSEASAAVSCYGGAKPWSSKDYKEHVGTFTTSSRCNDINVYTGWEAVSACVVFIDRTRECNRITELKEDGWTVVATDVRDGTRFQLHVFYVEYPERTGKVAS